MEEIKNIIKALCANFDSEYDLNYGDTIKEVVSNLKNTNYKFQDPNVFNTMFACQNEKIVNSIASEFHDPCKDRKNQSKANFIFSHYPFVEGHIRKLIEKRCGFSCVADRCRTIIREYLKWLITGELHEYNKEEEHFWIPKFGTYAEWFSYCDSLYGLYYGYVEDYLNSYQKLLTSEILKYEHKQHDWYMELQDGETFQFMTTYDENNENPLNNEYYQQENNYLIRQSLVPTHLIEQFYDSDLDGVQGKLLKSIPISNVKRIFHETKIVYL